MKMQTYFIDTFTSVPFKGNPTSVCFVADEIAESTMQAASNELNLPVTAFINKSVVEDEYNIKYFTPITEIPACGHATLASAKVVNMITGNEQIKFRTGNNVVIETTVEKSLVLMKYPKYDIQRFVPGKDILKSLGINLYKSSGFSNKLETLFIEVETPEELRSVNPSYPALIKSSSEIREVVITSVSDNEKYDYLLRSFCPWIGIDEDPVTGSVHSVLGPFWKDRLNKKNLKAYQTSKRGGELMINVTNEQVEIGGCTVVIMEGLFSVK